MENKYTDYPDSETYFGAVFRWISGSRNAAFLPAYAEGKLRCDGFSQG
jgi:hypothetical protein